MTFPQTATFVTSLFLALVFAFPAPAQIDDLRSSDPKQREEAAKKLGDLNDTHFIEPLAELLNDPVADVRSAAVASLIKIGTQHSLEPLQRATRDAMPEIQSMAVDGLVNFYYPGYVKFGWMNSIKSFGSSLKDRFRDPELHIIDPYVRVDEQVVRAIARVITGGSTMDSRANAARAAGILRGEAALPELQEALQSKNSTLIIEAVRAIEKIADLGAGPSLVFLLRDLDPDVQLAAIEAVGQLRVKQAVPDLVDLIKGARKKDIRRAAMVALAKIPDSGQTELFRLYLRDRDEEMRAAAAEGLGRQGEPSDVNMLKDIFAAEKKETARLSMAFAAVKLGDNGLLPYLIEALNSSVHRGEARPFLIELARDPDVLQELYAPLMNGTKNQKIELARVVAHSGTRDSIPHLEKLSHNADPDVAQEAIRAMKNLQARL